MYIIIIIPINININMPLYNYYMVILYLLYYIYFYIFIERETIHPTSGFRLLTPVQLLLAAHPQALQVSPGSPTLCPTAAGAMGRVLTPRGPSMAGAGGRTLNQLLGQKHRGFTAPSLLCQQNQPYLRTLICQQCK